MRLPKRSERGSLEFNMTPMIDVTFQLIIFFLLANRFSQQGAEVEKDVPAATMGEDDPGGATNQLVVNIAADGGLQLGASPVTLDKFGAELSNAKTDVEIRLRCDAATPFGSVRPVLAKCFDQQFGNVTFAVKPGAPIPAAN